MKKPKVKKFGYRVLISRPEGAPYVPTGGVHASRYLAEQYFHQELATSHTVTKFKIEGVRLNVSEDFLNSNRKPLSNDSGFKRS
jgi:hypothetical protein